MRAPQLIHFQTWKITKKSESRSRYINPLHFGQGIFFSLITKKRNVLPSGAMYMPYEYFGGGGFFGGKDWVNRDQMVEILTLVTKFCTFSHLGYPKVCLEIVG